MRISDWSSDVCSSDLVTIPRPEPAGHAQASFGDRLGDKGGDVGTCDAGVATSGDALSGGQQRDVRGAPGKRALGRDEPRMIGGAERHFACAPRSEEHTSELQSLMRISYAVFCLKKKK